MSVLNSIAADGDYSLDEINTVVGMINSGTVSAQDAGAYFGLPLDQVNAIVADVNSTAAPAPQRRSGSGPTSDPSLVGGEPAPIGVIDAYAPDVVDFNNVIEDLGGFTDFTPSPDLFEGDTTGLEETVTSPVNIVAGSPEAQQSATAYAEAELARIQQLYDSGDISQTEKAVREAQAVGDAGQFYGMSAEETAKAVNAVYAQYGVDAQFDANSVLNANGTVNVADNANVGLISNKFPSDVTQNSGGSAPSAADIIASVAGAVAGGVGGADNGSPSSGSPSTTQQPTQAPVMPIEEPLESWVYDAGSDVFTSTATGESFPASGTQDIPLEDGAQYTVLSDGGSGVTAEHTVVDATGQPIGKVRDTGTGFGLIPIGATDNVGVIGDGGVTTNNTVVTDGDAPAAPSIPSIGNTGTTTGGSIITDVDTPAAPTIPSLPNVGSTGGGNIITDVAPPATPTIPSIDNTGDGTGTGGGDGSGDGDGEGGDTGSGGGAGVGSNSIVNTLFGDDLLQLTPITDDIISPIALQKRRRRTLFGL